MSESSYKMALLNLTSKLRFLVKKCGLQCRVTSGTCDNALDCALPGLQRAWRVQFSHTGFLQLHGSPLSSCYSEAGKSLQSLWDVLGYGKPCLSLQSGADLLRGGICLQLPLTSNLFLNVSWALSGLFQGPAWQRYQESIAGVLQERSWRRWSMNSGVLVVRIC